MGMGWHIGIASAVRFAAMMAATRATPRTSPFFARPSRITAAVSGAIVIRPVAIATRSVSGLCPTSTMRALPASSKWVRPDFPSGVRCSVIGVSFLCAVLRRVRWWQRDHGGGSEMKSRSNAMIIMGIVTLVAVLAVTMLLGVPFWASLAIAVICALVAQWITGRQVGP